MLPPDLVFAIIVFLIVGFILLMRREHRLLDEEDPTLDTRGPDDR